MQNRITEFALAVSQENWEELEELLEALEEDHPQECSTQEELKDILSRMAGIIRAAAEDRRAGQLEVGLLNHMLERLREELRERMDKEVARDQSSARENWRDWVRQKSVAGAGWVHRWTKGPTAWQPQGVQHQGRWTGRPSDLLAAESARLKELWGAQDEPLPDFLPEPDQEELAPIDAKLLKRASRSFPARTAQTWGGFHPRHFAFLNEEELEAVCELLNWVERHGKCQLRFGAC